MSEQKTNKTFESLPFCMGPQLQPSNPTGIPDTLPLTLEINPRIPRLEQTSSKLLTDTLEKAYRCGIEMGTPLADTELGSAYAEDFIRFISEQLPSQGRALEIGAGVGYISYLLKQNGWEVDTIEPGKEYSTYWEKYGLNVINEFFPNDQAQGPYDLIVFYAVLEHIENIDVFITQVKEHLSPEGKIILSVPNCQMEIEHGDPSMLLHEHYHYFTPSTLKLSLEKNALNCHIEESGYGRAIYACASPSGKQPLDSSAYDTDVTLEDLIHSYFGKLESLQAQFNAKMDEASSLGTVGIYCPARVLPLLDSSYSVRFFDDSDFIQNKYYPPFNAKIESRESLLKRPVNTLFIMSWTFGHRLREALSVQLPDTRIITMDELT